MKILDMKCAEYGNKIASEGDVEMLITKALGVLQEDGVYAFFLYLSSLNNSESKNIKMESFEFLKQDEILGSVLGSQTDPLKAIRDSLSNKLDELLLAKELLERMLVYARYHAKAADNLEGEKKQTKESQ